MKNMMQYRRPLIKIRQATVPIVAIAIPKRVLIALVMSFAASPTATAEPERSALDQREEKRSDLLRQMKAIAQSTEVRYRAGDRRPQLVESPVFRYDDQPRHFIDATMWVWTDGGRPVAFQKIEAMARGRPEWGYCLTSVAEELLAVKWSDGREFRSTAPGIDFRPLVEASALPESNSARKLQARKVVRDFSARILTDASANNSEEMRLLPTPVFEYADPTTKEYLGAVFGLTTSGTNPDVLVLLEPRQADGERTWHYSVARMTIGGVMLSYRDKVVWQVDYYPPRPTAFPTWIFFHTWRNEPAISEKAQ